MSKAESWIRTVSDETRRLFALLVLYRWLSLIPPVIFTIIELLNGALQPIRLLTLASAICLSSLITLYSPRLNSAFQKHPWLLIFDLGLVAGIMAGTGGWRSPYSLYALSPLMAAAFFFQLRGAVISTSIFVPLYLTAVLASSRWEGGSPDWLTVITNAVGLYLISGVLGFAGMLLSRLRATGKDLIMANRNLGAAHRELEVLHALTTAIHGAADIEAVQEEVLLALTTQLGFERAVIGLVDQSDNVITGWIGRVREGTATEIRRPVHPARIPLSRNSGVVVQALLDGRTCRASREACILAEWVKAQFGMEGCFVVPMRWGVQPVGILLVDMPDSEKDSTRLASLEAIAQQSAVALGMMLTRLRRAQERAVHEERARLALEIHDTVSQSLFGIVFTLDGLLKLLPADSEVIRPELELALQTAESARKEIRHAIHDLWPEEITAAAFEEDLSKYVADTLQASNLQMRFDIRGEFALLSSEARRSLYRVSQESLTNVANHAAASEVSVCVDVGDGRARLSIRDDGRGFEPEIALAQVYGKGHFGLRGMRERALALGGTCEIFSQPGAGTTIIVDLPTR